MHSGEVAERANAALGICGILSRYMNPRNREVFLERIAFLYTRETNSNLARQLVGMLARNADELKSLETERNAAMRVLVELLRLGNASSSAEQIANRVSGHIQEVLNK